MAGRYGLRSKETTASPAVFKSPSKLLAEQLSSISVSDEASNAAEKKLRSAFKTGRKSLKENFAAFGGTPIITEPLALPEVESSVSTPGTRNTRQKIAVQSTSRATSSTLHTRPASAASDHKTGRKSVSPVVTKASTKTPAKAKEESPECDATYQDAMLPSFTSFGRRKTNGGAIVKRRAKKLILDAVSQDAKMETAEEKEAAAAKAQPVKLPPIDLSWLNVDDLAELVVPELQNRRIVADQLMQRYRRDFGKWVVQLLSGFNLLFHGLGSKRDLLTEFCDAKLLPGGFNVVEFDGWRPDFNFGDFIKELFFGYCRQSEDLKLSDAEMIGRIESYIDASQSHLVLLVHSIDGVEIRGNRKFHTTLSSLAKRKRVHVIASADHVNFPLMWDTATVENFNWIYVEAPTFEPPVVESRSNECSLLRSILRAHSTTGAHVTLTSVRHVVFSLTPNAIKMFILLCYIFVEKQARRTAAKKAKKSKSKKADAMDDDVPGDEGIVQADLLLPLTVLYKHCRDQFIVSSYELMLKHLRELFDHTLAKQVKHPEDGVDCLQMNLSGELASSFLDECRAGEYAQFLDSLSTDIEL